MFASSRCCSTARRCRGTERSSPISAAPGSGSLQATKTPSASGSTELPDEASRFPGRLDRTIGACWRGGRHAGAAKTIFGAAAVAKAANAEAANAKAANAAAQMSKLPMPRLPALPAAFRSQRFNGFARMPKLGMRVAHLVKRNVPSSRLARSTLPRTAGRQLNASAAILALSVLADSAVEHYRGSFQNRAMYTPLAVAALTLGASLFGVDRPASRTPPGARRDLRLGGGDRLRRSGLSRLQHPQAPGRPVVAQFVLRGADRRAGRADARRACSVAAPRTCATRRCEQRATVLGLPAGRVAGRGDRDRPCSARSAKPACCIFAAPFIIRPWCCR